jgi:two-component system, LytTR family, response regulator
MRKIRTIIVDDEPLAREGIRLLVQNDAPIEIISECANGREAVRAIDRHAPDLLFLDVQMPEMNGFDVLNQINIAQTPTVIFVTAYDNYALQAFEAQALDYLLKPFSDERFYRALARAKAQIEQNRIKEQNQKLKALITAYKSERRPDTSAPCLERLIIKSAGRVLFLDAPEIDWIEAADYYVLLHVGDKSHILRETMTELEAKLDPRKFIRIHRSIIVNIERAVELRARGYGDYLVILRNGAKLKPSRRRRKEIQLMLKRLS